MTPQIVEKAISKARTGNIRLRHFLDQNGGWGDA
jgi:hypothetical protein